MKLSRAIRTAIIEATPISELLGKYSGSPGVFTRRPVPEGALYPLVIVPSENAGASDEDGLRSFRPVLQKDVLVYGEQPDQYRLVDDLADALFVLFHRQKRSISVEGFHVIDIVARRPIQAPTSDAKRVGRLVPLTIRLQDLAG
jgi:hypothetical protein